MVQQVLPRQHRQAGSWILIEAGMRLLSIDQSQYRGHSPKSALDHVARRALLPRVQHCILNGTSSTSTARFKDRSWLVRVKPVKAPASGSVLAVLGCYVAEGASMRPPPVVGAWETTIRTVDDRRTPRTIWSKDLYSVCGMVPRTGEARDTGDDCEGLEWLDQLLLPSDRAEIRRIIDDGGRHNAQPLVLGSGTVRSPDTGEVHALRYAKRRLPDPDHDSSRHYAGVAYRLPTCASVRPAAAPLLDAVLEISQDPLLAVDGRDELVYVASKAFTALPLAVPISKHLPSMCHPDDVSVVREMLRHCANSTDKRMGSRPPITVRMAAADGGWLPVAITGIGMFLGGKDGPGDVLCRLEVANRRGEATA